MSSVSAARDSRALSHQREQDFGYSDKADGERDNCDGKLLTDHPFAAKSVACSAPRLVMPFVGGCDRNNAARYLQAGTGDLGRAQGRPPL